MPCSFNTPSRLLDLMLRNEKKTRLYLTEAATSSRHYEIHMYWMTLSLMYKSPHATLICPRWKRRSDRFRSDRRRPAWWIPRPPGCYNETCAVMAFTKMMVRTNNDDALDTVFFKSFQNEKIETGSKAFNTTCIKGISMGHARNAQIVPRCVHWKSSLMIPDRACSASFLEASNPAASLHLKRSGGWNESKINRKTPMGKSQLVKWLVSYNNEAWW